MRTIHIVAVTVVVAVGPSKGANSPVRAEGDARPALTTLPSDYREWRLISVAHEEGKQNDIRAILGNDVAYEAARDGKLAYPDGAILARLAWTYLPSEENNKAFGQVQSYIAGQPTNVQLMVKDSTKYAATGGWSYLQFNNGQLGNPKGFEACFVCHIPVKARDYVFTRFSP